MRRYGLFVLALPMLAGGCLSTAASVVKAPFQAAGKAVDWTTTSQEESDRNYGRRMRKAEAREGKERREWEKRCRKEPRDCGEYQGYHASDERR